MARGKKREPGTNVPASDISRDHTQTGAFRHLQRLTLPVVFEDVIALRRLNGRAEEDDPIRCQVRGDRPEKRRRIGQVLSQHRRDDSLVALFARRTIHAERITHREADAIAMS